MCNIYPPKSRHVVTSSRQSINFLETIEVEECLFHKCKAFIVEHNLASYS